MANEMKMTKEPKASRGPLVLNQAENEFKVISERLLEWEKQYRTHSIRDIDQKT